MKFKIPNTLLTITDFKVDMNSALDLQNETWQLNCVQITSNTRKQYNELMIHIYVLRKVGIDTILEWLCAK